MWEGYVAFREAIVGAGPEHLSLRDKDRYLWAEKAVGTRTAPKQEADRFWLMEEGPGLRVLAEML